MISFIVPCYNHNQILTRAVESLLIQPDPKEIIVVDDGSSTPIENIWGHRVKLIKHQGNKGLSAFLMPVFLAPDRCLLV